jgi:hypothetical protein
MDSIDRSRSRFVIESLQRRIHQLQERLTARIVLGIPKESTLRKLKFAVLFFTAAIAGTIAHRLNAQEFELQWKRSHVPSENVWRTSFSTEGFRRIDNPSIQGRLTRSLPSLSDGAGKIWSSTPDWWAVEIGGTSQPLVFCLSCDLKKAPSNWNEAGSGWEGWESAIKTAREQARTLALTAIKPRKRGESLDPRAIRY